MTFETDLTPLEKLVEEKEQYTFNAQHEEARARIEYANQLFNAGKREEATVQFSKAYVIAHPDDQLLIEDKLKDDPTISLPSHYWFEYIMDRFPLAECICNTGHITVPNEERTATINASFRRYAWHQSSNGAKSLTIGLSQYQLPNDNTIQGPIGPIKTLSDIFITKLYFSQGGGRASKSFEALLSNNKFIPYQLRRAVIISEADLKNATNRQLIERLKEVYQRYAELTL